MAGVERCALGSALGVVRGGVRGGVPGVYVGCVVGTGGVKRGYHSLRFIIRIPW